MYGIQTGLSKKSPSKSHISNAQSASIESTNQNNAKNFGSRIPRIKFDLRVAVVPRSSIMLTFCSSVKNADLQSCGINGQLERL
jgi:hypothetical protein